MSGYLLDINVVSELAKAALNNGAVVFLSDNEDFLLSEEDVVSTLTEVDVEQAALGWAVTHDPHIAPTPQTPSAIPTIRCC